MADKPAVDKPACNPDGSPVSQSVYDILARQLGRYQDDERRNHRVIEVLIAAGFLTREKYEEARAIVESLP